VFVPFSSDVEGTMTVKGSRQGYFRCGHPYVKENMYMNCARDIIACRTCRLEKQRVYAKKPETKRKQALYYSKDGSYVQEYRDRTKERYKAYMKERNRLLAAKGIKYWKKGVSTAGIVSVPKDYWEGK
jgi:hypothetical protein